MNLLAIISHFRFKDVVDILILTVFAYHLYVWFQGTKAFKALVGLMALGIIYTAAQSWDLFLTTWMFQILWQVLIIMLIILFQSEIRQVLERMNPLRAFRWHKVSQSMAWIQRFADTCFLLANHKSGALVILERTDRVDEMITGGTFLEGDPSQELLMSIFEKASPLHDGAVLIREGKVVRVGAFLPLSSTETLSAKWGTRHRAAIGLSERCDAWVVIVSEERGEVSLARSGSITTADTPAVLSNLIAEALEPPADNQVTLIHRLRSFVVQRWHLKLGMLAFVSVLWLLFAGQQDFEVTLQVPLQIKNCPANMEILHPLDPRIKVTIRGLRKDASTVRANEVYASVDLSMAAYGWKNFRITRDQIVLPNQLVSVVRIDPTEITFDIEEKAKAPAADVPP